MKLIDIHNKLYAVPENWNELTGRQVIKVMQVMYGNYDANAGRLVLLRILTGMSWYRFFRTPVGGLSEFLDLSEFLLEGNRLTKQVLPMYRGLYGPDDNFNNLTGEEFVFSEDFYFKSFSQAGPDEPRVMNEAGLTELVAVLYRRKKKGYDLARNIDGDPRVPFNQYECSWYARKVVARWPMAVKLAVFTWYEACRQQMIEANPEIFTGGSGEPAKYGLLSVMRVIAEGGIHGDFEKVLKMYVHLWMVELNEKTEEVKRQEKNT